MSKQARSTFCAPSAKPPSSVVDFRSCTWPLPGQHHEVENSSPVQTRSSSHDEIDRRRSTLSYVYVLNPSINEVDSDRISDSTEHAALKVNGKTRECRSPSSVFDHHFRTLLGFQIAFVLLCTACLAFFSWARLAFPCDLNTTTFSDANMRKAVPNVLWLTMWDRFVFTMLCVVTWFWSVIELSAPPVALTLTQKWTSIVIFPAINVTLYLVLRGTPLHPIGDLIGLLILEGMFVFFVLINSQHLAKVKPYSAFRRTTLLLLVLKVFLLHTLGYLISLMFVSGIFPWCQTKLKELAHGNSCSWCETVRLGSELLLVFLFLSVWQPIWKKFFSKAILRLSMYSRTHTSDQKYISVIRVCAYFACDVLFLVFGRGIICSVSNRFIFCMLLLKDFSRYCWDYGFRSMDEYIIFMLKVSIPEERKNLEGMWLYISCCIEWFMHIYDVPKKIATIWLLPIDCQHTIKGWRVGSEKNDACISLFFDDLSLTLQNLPTRISDDPQEVSDTESDRFVTNAAAGQKPRCSTERSVFSDFTRKIRRKSRSEYSSFPHFPVSAEEIRKFRPLTTSIHGYLFERYQIRAMAKFYISFLLLAIPMFASFTNVRYVAGYVSPLEDANILFDGGLYMVADMVEWLIITVGVHYEYEGIHDHIEKYRALFQSQKLMIFIFFFSTGMNLGSLFSTVSINPFNAASFARKYPGTDLETIIETCTPFF